MSISSLVNNPNYLRTQSITNATAAAIPVPAVVAGAVLGSLALVQTVGLVEQILVLGAGYWSISANSTLDPVDGGQTIEFMQAQIIDSVTGFVYGSSPCIFGATAANSANVPVNLNTNIFLRIKTKVSHTI